MANPHSTRRRAGPTERARRGASAAPTAPGGLLSVARSEGGQQGQATRMDASRRPDLARQLDEVVWRLRVVYSTCVVAQLALAEQNAGQDRDILAVLRNHVSDAVSRQAEKLSALAANLGRTPVERLP